MDKERAKKDFAYFAEEVLGIKLEAHQKELMKIQIFEMTDETFERLNKKDSSRPIVGAEMVALNRKIRQLKTPDSEKSGASYEDNPVNENGSSSSKKVD